MQATICGLAIGFAATCGLLQNPDVPRRPRLALIYSEDFSGHEEFSLPLWEKIFGTGKAFMILIYL
jgi:hypothetical protein